MKILKPDDFQKDTIVTILDFKPVEVQSITDPEGNSQSVVAKPFSNIEARLYVIKSIDLPLIVLQDIITLQTFAIDNKRVILGKPSQDFCSSFLRCRPEELKVFFKKDNHLDSIEV